ncbi:MAG TPA: hypothetical protein ENJ88_06755 [Phaeodactylibacter sp.]|nr:hypothetical protein [Phaeodactylibacter sp.]
MHAIEPHFLWRELYIASEDAHSPFYGRVYDEFVFSQRIYNYLIHPQWDAFGSPTLYIKLLFADYEEGYAIFEMLGEWNDCLQNDIMFLKREVIEPLQEAGICRFVLLCEQVLSFHGSDDCYYEEWFEEVSEEGGWIVFLNLLPHVTDEMRQMNIHHFVQLGEHCQLLEWRTMKPQTLYRQVRDGFLHVQRELG